MILPTTLTMAAAAALINLWLGMRIGKLRHAMNINVGDGGNEMVMRRMRAQLNFIEQTPVFLILVAAIEFAGKGSIWLAPVAGLFMLGRIAHGIGMDGKLAAGRMAGTLTAMLGNLGLAVVAVMIALGYL